MRKTILNFQSRVYLVSQSPQDYYKFNHFSAMFGRKQKENTMYAENNTPVKQALLNFSKQKSREQRQRKINNLRQISISHVLDWHQPIQKFNFQLHQNRNQYSLLLTLFQIVDDPKWRSKIPHLCSLIKVLHNICVDKNGYYLAQITNIPDYHSKLCRIFCLSDNMLQQHFKLFIMVYLSYNYRFCILDEGEVALGLIETAKNRTDDSLQSYLWIVCQIRVDARGILKLLKIGTNVLQIAHEVKIQKVDLTILPIITSIANYICNEREETMIYDLVQNNSFQDIFMYSLANTNNIDLRQEALLVCSNLVAFSPQMAIKIMESQQIMNAALAIQCEELQHFQQLVILRKQQFSGSGQY